MTYWLLITILAYLFFGLSSFGDKLVLDGKTERSPKPKTYTFYVGVLSLFAILLIPFTEFGFPSQTGLIWVVLDAVVQIIGVYTMFVAIKKFDVSRVVPTIGATQPIFIFTLTWIFWGPQVMSANEILAFVLLFLGSFIISFKRNLKITGSYLAITLFSSVMFSLDYIFAKFVFLDQPFLQGLIWTRIFIFLVALVFLIKKSSREEIFSKKVVSDKKNQAAFLFAQASGGAANFLQSFAISLSPVAFLAIVNSLKGVQYIFLFLITLFVSFVFPRLLKEEISKKIIIQKVISIVIIAVGLAILVVS